MNSDINNSIFEAYIKSKTPIVENKQESEQVIEEAAKSKPDFLDIDHDGNKKESMKKAAADAKKAGGKKGGKKGMSAKQAKFFGKKKKAVKENVNLNADQQVLKENIRAILQKNGLSDLVTPKMLKAMLEAFALGKTVNEGSADHRKGIKAAYENLKKSIEKMKKEGKEIPSALKAKLERFENKVRV